MITYKEYLVARRSGPACRVQAYISDVDVANALNAEAQAARVTLSQAAARAIARGLEANVRSETEERLLHLEAAMRDHMRLTTRDLQIIQELVVEVARAFFLRLPDALVDQDPTVQAAVDRRIEQLLDATAERILAGRARRGRRDIQDRSASEAA